MSYTWFEDISSRCPWFRGVKEKNFCTARSHESLPACKKETCAPFFMAATIISAYKQRDKSTDETI